MLLLGKFIFTSKFECPLIFKKSIYLIFKEPLSEEDIYNKDLCMKANSVIAGNCVLKCGGDSSCEYNCIDDFRSRNDDCPCEVSKHSC